MDLCLNYPRAFAVVLARCKKLNLLRGERHIELRLVGTRSTFVRWCPTWTVWGFILDDADEEHLCDLSTIATLEKMIALRKMIQGKSESSY